MGSLEPLIWGLPAHCALDCTMSAGAQLHSRQRLRGMRGCITVVGMFSGGEFDVGPLNGDLIASPGCLTHEKGSPLWMLRISFI